MPGGPMDWTLRVEMPNGDKYDVPVAVIARDRASYYAGEFGGGIEQSLAEDTLPLFTATPFEIQDWAANNMDWRDVEKAAVRVLQRPALSLKDLQEGWVNGEKEIVKPDGS